MVETLTWSQREIRLSLVPTRGAGLGASELLLALESSAERWNTQTATLGAPRFVIERSPQAIVDAVQDGVSSVLLLTDKWCPSRARDEEEGCYDQARQAITHLYSSAGSSPIVEVDLQVNGVGPAWRSPAGVVDQPALEALIMHELGHVLGLDHSCGLQMSAGVAAGEQNRSCATEQARSSVMYPDPLEAGRALVLEPTSDALTLLRTRYQVETTTATPSWSMGAALLAVALGLLLGGLALRHFLAPPKAKAG